MSKLDLKVCQGTGFDNNTNYSLKLEIVNTDTSAISLSAVRVVGYMWSQNPLFSQNLTSGVDSIGEIKTISNSPSPNFPGLGQTGIVPLTTNDYVYRINHNLINSITTAPIVTLNIPNNNSYISPVSVSNRTDYYFDIVLTELPPNNSYSVTWFIPDTEEIYVGGTTAIPAPKIQFLSVTPSVRVDSRKTDSKFIISWDSVVSIPASCGVVGTQIFIKPTSGTFFNSSKPLNSWYSQPEISPSAVDNSYFILEEWNGSSWVVISEYTNYGTDIDSGIGPTTTNQVKLKPSSSTGMNRSVYIRDGVSNPISTNAPDEDGLFLQSLANTKTRSLIKYDLSDIPLSATSIRNAVLRLNVNSTSGAWNYTNSNGHVSVHRVTKNWHEDEVDWTYSENSSATIMWSNPGGDYDSLEHVWLGNTNLNNNFTSSTTSAQFWIDVNVTDIVEYWRTNPEQNYGFIIKLTPSVQENSIQSIQYNIDSFRGLNSPELIVAYNVPNSTGPIPELEFVTPIDESVIIGNVVNFKVNSNISGGAVTNVDIFYKLIGTQTIVSAGSLVQTTPGVWTGSIQFSISGTNMEVFAQGESDLGVLGLTDSIRISFATIPSVGVSTTGVICHDGEIQLVGNIDLSSGVPTTSYISLSGTFLPTSASVFSCIEDRLNPNVMWFSTFGNGIWRYDSSADNQWTNYNSTNSPIPSDKTLAMAMKADGNLFFSMRNDNNAGYGIMRFDTTKWNSFNNNDWDWFNETNSIFSEYGQPEDVFSMSVDQDDNVWIGLTWKIASNVLKLNGLNLNRPFVTVYNSSKLVDVRSIGIKNGNIAIGYSSNNIDIYSSATDLLVGIESPIYGNVRDIDFDQAGNLYACFIGGLGYYNFATSAWSYVTQYNTPVWPNGLGAVDDKAENNYCASVYVDSNNVKWFGFSKGDVGEYNGGVLKFTGNNFDTSAISTTANWQIYDKSNNISIPSSNISVGMTKDSSGRLWISTDKGVSRFDNLTWNSPNFDNITNPIVVDESGNWSSVLVNSDYKNPLNLIANFQYENNLVQVPFSLSASRIPVLTRTYPNSDISIINDSMSNKLFEFSVDGVDFVHGDIVSYEILKSNTSTGPFNTISANIVTENIKINDIVYPNQISYYKIIAYTTLGCSAESQLLLAYGNTAPKMSLEVSPGPYNTVTPITLSGSFFDVDLGTPLVVNQYSSNDSVNYISLSSNDGFIGNASIKQYQNFGTSGTWEYVWNTPSYLATTISATVYDYFGGSARYSLPLSSSIIDAPNITLFNPPTSGLYSIQNTNIQLSATVSTSNTIVGTKFFISNGISAIDLGIDFNSGINWAKTINLSSTLSAFNNVGGEYTIYVSAIDNLGISNISEPHKISANYLPSFTLTSPSGPACHNGSIQVIGSVSDNNSTNQSVVRILSGSTVLTSGTTVNNDFVWNWNSPPTGIHSLSAKVFDSSNSADFSITNFIISAGQTPNVTIINNYPSGIKNGSIVSPKINVVGQTIIISATISTPESTSADFWFSDSFGNKISQISAASPTTSATITFENKFNEIQYVLVDVYTTVGCKSSNILPFYVMYPEVELDNFSNCSETIKIKGNLYFDGISGTNDIVDNIFVCNLSANNTFLTALNLIQIGNEYLFDYDWNTPVVGTSSLTFGCVNSYGTFSTQVNINSIVPGNIVNSIYPISYIQELSGIYITSSNSVTISSTLNIADIEDLSFIIESDSGIEVIASNTGSISFSPVLNKLYNIKAITKTIGGCDIYSDYITIIRTNFVSSIESIISNGCSNNNISVNGYVGKLNYATGSYDSSASPNILSTEAITAYVNDSFGNLVYTISANSLSAGSDNNILGFNFEYLPLIGTSALTLYTSSTLFSGNNKTKTIHTVEDTVFGNLTNPISGINYSLFTPVDFGISANSSNIKKVIYYVDGLEVTNSTITPFSATYSFNMPGVKKVKADIISLNDCKYTTSEKDIVITSMPIGLITSPVNNSYILSGTNYSINVLTSPSQFGIISAVDVYSNTDVLLSSATKINSNVWTISNTQTISGTYAKIYDTAGLSATTPTNIINVIYPTVTTISANSATFNMYDSVIVNVSAFTPNSATIETIEVYELVGGEYNYISATDNILTLQASIFGPGLHSIVAKSIDSKGAYSYSPSINLTVNSLLINSYPVITYVSSNPENRINEYGNATTSVFTVSDYTYGILSASIAVNAGKVIDITSLTTNKLYQVTIEVSATGNVTISATNLINKSSSYTVNNYIFSCSDNREVNLTNFIPNHLTYDSNGNESEFFTLTNFFETYLNTIYTNLDEPCSIGILEKTNRLRNLHDADTMELDYIQYFANYLGYNVDVNRSELGGFTISQNSSGYDDGPDDAEVFSEYQKKALRFVIRNLPNWYSIKTTRNAIKTLLLSFGIFGDLLEIYSNDYTNDWVINNTPPGIYVSNSMDKERFPTPHMYVAIDLNNTDLDNVYGSNQTLSSLYKSFEAIRPANVVFEGLVGQYSATMPEVYVSARCMLEQDFIISKSVQIPAP